jgi:hypothetical protein
VSERVVRAKGNVMCSHAAIETFVCTVDLVGNEGVRGERNECGGCESLLGFYVSMV